MSTAIPTVWNGHDYMQHTYPELQALLRQANDEQTLMQLRLVQMNPENLVAYHELTYRKPDVIQSAIMTKLKAGEFY